MTEVFVTPSEVRLLEIESLDNNQASVLEVEQSVIEVITEGRQGPAGVPKALRVDTTNSGVIYTGKAKSGSLENSSTWTVTRSTFNSAGVRTSKGAAVNVTWTGRAGHTYT